MLYILYKFLSINYSVNKNVFEPMDIRKNKNKFYKVIGNDSELIFMEFKNPNAVIPHDYYYTIIDSDLYDEIKKDYWSGAYDNRENKAEQIVGEKLMKIGGHLGNGNVKLHEFVYYSKNTTKLHGYEIHHAGHTFDNRYRYLRLTNGHRILHDIEKRNDNCRPSYVPRDGSFQLKPCHKFPCACNNSILTIHNENELTDFIRSLNSIWYKRL